MFFIWIIVKCYDVVKVIWIILNENGGVIFDYFFVISVINVVFIKY